MSEKDFCTCTKEGCPLHGNCKACIMKHNKANQIPHCLFPEHGGDRSKENFYKSLKGKYTEEGKK